MDKKRQEEVNKIIQELLSEVKFASFDPKKTYKV